MSRNIKFYGYILLSIIQLDISSIVYVEHIVCVFPENIISRFDVSVNDVVEEFTELLRLKNLKRKAC